ncbi:transglutaminase family protein [Actinoalloteichus caeruleus]|uniref:Transglutaminase-like superfamily protein n=1 Tax=Actinoalloteichus caeruleus DSM 43889 TaxID=1120930 RepID=A0ABT1JQQ2_ACTCY|nr:DUF3488 and transglutaminase-like domain-containing protein [Actinoalloteichus caeruleus]MCP2334471.1 Transglutaminase-like superfamily protein [Actinoalloteichus caeruleus DSM 43889]
MVGVEVGRTDLGRHAANAVLCGLAMLGAASAVTGIVDGAGPILLVALAVFTVAAAGVALRVMRLPAWIVVTGQLLVLSCLVTVLFTGSGVLGLLPGPEAVREVLGLLGESLEQVKVGVPPVEATAPILCLLMLSIGVVAVVADLLAVGLRAPAAAGLLLLSVFAIPASLAREMLPWWTFAAGAVGFALLLAVDGRHRQRVLAGAATDSGAPRNRWTPAATATTALSVAAALVAGASLTFIGTEGRFPGGGGGGGGGDQGGYGVGLNTFTSLRGQLDRETTIDLLRVEGMRERQYLRAFTLSHYDPGEGWRLGPVDEGVDAAAGRPLPRPAGSARLPAESSRIRVEPLNYQDHWLPVFGVPTVVDDVAPGWRYDARSGLIYAEESRRATPYTVEAVVPEYPLEELRTAPDPQNVDPVYLRLDGVTPEVSALADRLAAPHAAPIDKANALTAFFRDPANGFQYSLETETGSGSDALADFLFEGRTGYCEQYSSALAVLLRSIGVPARVAVGFSPGYQTGTSRLITNNEAHAWVEGYFEGFGWISFEPTPLNDGRAVEPAHSTPEESDRPDRPEETDSVPTTTAPTDTSTTTSDAPQAGHDEGVVEPGKGAFPVALWVWLVVGVLVSAALTALVAGLTLGRRRATGTGPGELDAWLRPVAATRRVLRFALCGAVAATLVPVLWWLVLPVGPDGLWWLAAVLLPPAVVVASPPLLRSSRRRIRLQTVRSGWAGAATAAWAEVLDLCADRGSAPPASDTVRVAVDRLSRQYRFDGRTVAGLTVLAEAVEREWYAPSAAPSGELAGALDSVLAGFHRNAPPRWVDRVVPPSTRRRPRRAPEGPSSDGAGTE